MDEVKRNNNMLEYKCYKAKIEFSAEDKLIIGIVTNANGASVSFHCCSVDEIEPEFIKCVQDYIDILNEIKE